MDVPFGIIRAKNDDIPLDKWEQTIREHASLELMPDREGVDPFTKKKVTFSGSGKAYYIEGDQRVGNLSLEDGAVLTTGVPLEICLELARQLHAEFEEDDRS